MDKQVDDLDRSIARRTATNPEYPRLLEAEIRRQRLIERLIELRVANHLTQVDVARVMGVTQSVVAEIESTAVDVRYTTLDRYVAAVSGGSARLTLARRKATGATRPSSR
jgi:DNA-binding XRE family transcriptional regulator